MKKYTLVLMFILVCKSIFCQQIFFNKIFKTNGSEQSRGLQESDSFYFVSGHQIDTTSNFQRMFIYTLNKQGALLHHFPLYTDSFDYYAGFKGAMTISFDKCIAIAGSILDTNNDVYGFVNKISFNNNSFWKSDFKDTISLRQGNWLTVRDMKQTPDSGFILAAQIYGDQPMETRCMLIKTDSLGNMQWYNNSYFSYNIETQPWEIVVTPDSGYLVVGYKWDGYDQNGWILKTDKYGTMQWQKVLGGQYDDFINAACITPDGNIVVVLNDQFQDVGYKISQMQVIKYSMAGAVIWNKQFYYNRSITCKSIVAMDDNSLALTGYNYVIDTILQKYAEPSYIFKLNPQGDSVWFRHFIYHSSNPNVLDYLNKSTAIDMISTSDGGFLVCGDYIQYPPNVVPQSSWLVKLDSLGCDTPGCQLIGVKELEIRNEKLEIFPNPFGEEIHIGLPESFLGGKLVMYDVQGKKAMETEVPANWGQQNFALETPDLKPGVYLVELVGEDGGVWRRRVLKQ
jgi:hypothetical protein